MRQYIIQLSIDLEIKFYYQNISRESVGKGLETLVYGDSRGFTSTNGAYYSL